jgi:hypothetical protein
MHCSDFRSERKSRDAIRHTKHGYVPAGKADVYGNISNASEGAHRPIEVLPYS